MLVNYLDNIFSILLWQPGHVPLMSYDRVHTTQTIIPFYTAKTATKLQQRYMLCRKHICVKPRLLLESLNMNQARTQTNDNIQIG